MVALSPLRRFQNFLSGCLQSDDCKMCGIQRSIEPSVAFQGMDFAFIRLRLV